MSQVLVRPPWPVWNESNVLLHKRVTYKQVCDYTGPLSLKYVVEGEVRWTTRDGDHVARAGQFLLLNRGQTYSTNIRTETPTEPVTIGFAPGFFERSFPCASLEEPFAMRQFSVIERVYDADKRIACLMLSLRDHIDSAQNEWMQERFLQLSNEIVRLHLGEKARSEGIDASRPATREELYRRLMIARDYIEANCQRQLSILEVSHIAGLSPTHLYRHFSALFGLTPAQYTTSARLREARRLLATSSLSVAVIAHRVGFQSVPSFCTLFRKRFGQTPSEFHKSQIGRIR